MPADTPRPLRSPGRERCLEHLLAQLGGGELGRTFGLHRVGSLVDLRAQVPLLDARAHAGAVDPLLGFAAEGEPADVGAAAERDEVVAVWRTWLSDPASSDLSKEPLRAALLQARRPDPAVDAIAADDLAALGAEVLRIHALTDPAREIAQLADFDPALLLSPSAAAFVCLEEQVRGPLERRLRGLRLLLASFDVRLRLRARVPLHAAGWIDPRAGRVALPSLRPPARGFTLALASAILELLPPGPDAHRGPVELHTLWPEHAILGERYELVVSSGTGCLRLRTGEFVRVVGFDPPTRLVPFPRPRVVRLPAPDPPVALAGLSLPGAELAASVRAAFRPEDPALVAATIGPDPQSLTDVSPRASGSGPWARADPRPNHFADTELGSADVSGVRRRLMPTGLRVQIEVQGEARAHFRARLAAAIDADLARRSPAYAHLRAQQMLRPPRVEMVPPGAFRAEWERNARRLDHKVGVPTVRVLATTGAA